MKTIVVSVLLLGALIQGCNVRKASDKTSPSKVPAMDPAESPTKENQDPVNDTEVSNPEETVDSLTEQYYASPLTSGLPPANPGRVTGGKVVVRAPTKSDLKVMANCSKAWGAEAPKFDKVRVIVANLALLGQSKLIDETVSETPELTIVVASVGILSRIEWHLKNPNGFYCMVANVNVASSMKITLNKQARLADGAVAVNVLAKGTAGAANVNVLSKVKVVREE